MRVATEQEVFWTLNLRNIDLNACSAGIQKASSKKKKRTSKYQPHGLRWSLKKPRHRKIASPFTFQSSALAKFEVDKIKGETNFSYMGN